MGTAADLAACIDIEIAAASRFEAAGMPELVAITAGDPYMRSHGEAHAADGSLLVFEEAGAVIGYAAMSQVDGLAHLCEIDVLPTHSGQGIGRALMTACKEWARARRLPAITLSTFIAIPWNGPWYARQGFEPYPPADWPPEHQAIWQGQVASALDTSKRQMMIRTLRPVLHSAAGRR